MRRKRHGLFFILMLLPPLLLLALAFWWGQAEQKKDLRFEHTIAEAAHRYQIDPHLIRAVIWRESGFDPDAVGLVGERGLMQVREVAAREWAEAENIQNFRPADLLDPRTNILAGSWYLARAISRWPDADQPEVFGLAEYNAGRTHARRWARDLPQPVAAAFIESIDFPTTKKYILDILERREAYRLQPRPPIHQIIWDKITGMWWRWQERRTIQRLKQSAAE